MATVIEERIPFHISISEPVQVDPRSINIDPSKPLTPGHYDSVSQMWLGEDGLPRDVRLSSSTTSDGISGTTIGGIIFSDQHPVSDD